MKNEQRTKLEQDGDIFEQSRVFGMGFTRGALVVVYTHAAVWAFAVGVFLLSLKLFGVS